MAISQALAAMRWLVSEGFVHPSRDSFPPQPSGQITKGYASVMPRHARSGFSLPPWTRSASSPCLSARASRGRSPTDRVPAWDGGTPTSGKSSSLVKRNRALSA